MSTRQDLASVEALGWAGPVTRITTIGISVVCTYTVKWPAHRARVAANRPPCPDPGQLHCLFGSDPWPTPAPVSLNGLLVSGRSWRSAAADAAALSAFAAVAVRLPEARCTAQVATDADLFGIGLLALGADGAEQLIVPPARHTPPPHTRMQTLMAELVYDTVWSQLLVAA